ncbi:hypothetical protein GXW78_20055 [Roseomonas terrae]|jgi:hypothetical protein|uniref:Uncharacterized protein n=1 Tax=Neoroseomonas terrae TaxID=424799 RepID=A0ABS5ELR5_9PROT|nr:hypothetical protein [Neoroseomonas terrae]MBR0651969.1 hypothetical protein [Neoroseomonas terrae]
MRAFYVIAPAAGLLLAACTVNNPPAPAPVVVQEPMRAVPPGSTVIPPGSTVAPPGSVIVPPRY